MEARREAERARSRAEEAESALADERALRSVAQEESRRTSHQLEAAQQALAVAQCELASMRELLRQQASRPPDVASKCFARLSSALLSLLCPPLNHCLHYERRCYRNSHCPPPHPPMHAPQHKSSLIVFSMAELESATSTFSEMLKIGEGGFGDVFRVDTLSSVPSNGPMAVSDDEDPRRSVGCNCVARVR